MTENTLTQIRSRPAAEAQSRIGESGAAIGLAAAVGAGIFVLGYSNGGFPITTRNAVAIAVLWTLTLTAAAAPWAYRALRGLAAVPALALLGLAILSLTSLLWTSNGEAALNAFDLDVLYAAAYVFGVVAVRAGRLVAWRDGIAGGLTAVAIAGLVSRLAPSWLGANGAFDFLPVGYVRLSFPVGYWNALGVLVAITVPLLLRSAIAPRPIVLRALAVLPLPALAATAYLTSSRNGFLSTGIGIVLLILLARRRWAIVGAVVAATGGSVLAIHALVVRRELVNGPLDSAAAAAQRGGAAWQIALACVGAALLYAVIAAVSERLPRRQLVPEVAPAAAVVLAVVVAVIAVHPVRQFDRFRTTLPPANSSANYVQGHLLSASANGRWQLWQAALHEYRAHPVLGGGAGSFSEWWLQHRPVVGFVQNAHSLYLETLAELGPLGLVLLLIVFGAAAAAAAAVVRRGSGEVRDDGAALAASVLLFGVAAGLDWVWIVPAVTVPAVLLLALLTRTARATATSAARRRARPLRPEAAVAIWAGAAIGLCGLLYAQAAPLLSQRNIEQSYAAVRAGDAARAQSAALAARNLTPWAATPYLQLALIDETAGRLGEGRHWISEAIDRDPRNWQLWLVAARLAAKDGEVATARAQLARATALNPLALQSALG